MTRYETWEERDGMRQRVGTDAPAGVQLVDAADYDKLEAELAEAVRVLQVWMTDVSKCTCIPAYKERGLTDPQCHYCEYDYPRELTQAFLTRQETNDE
jgi:hypothetical protein